MFNMILLLKGDRITQFLNLTSTLSITRLCLSVLPMTKDQ